MEQLANLYNHIVLPPQLPHHQDTNHDDVGDGLVTRLLSACNNFGDDTDSDILYAFRNLRNSLSTCYQLNKHRLDKHDLLEAFETLKHGKVIILHINEQNAGLLIRLTNDEEEDFVIFETFEASAPSATVLGAVNAIQWDFPGRAVRVCKNSFCSTSFQKCLADFLERASMEALQNFQSSTKKAGVAVTEVRDVTDPALISQMLMSLLEARGESAPVPLLRKRIRDDVSFQSSQKPWRRHPFWLILRVAAQRLLYHALGVQVGRLCYKLLMSLFHADFLQETTGKLAPELVSRLRAKLSRRMAKLETERCSCSEARVAFDELFEAMKPKIEAQIQHATKAIDAAWSKFKTANKRPVLVLPRHAVPEDTRVALINSERYFDSVLTSRGALPNPAGAHRRITEDMSKVSESQNLANQYMDLSKLDQKVAMVSRDCAAQPCLDELRCKNLASEIVEYISHVHDKYKGDSEQASVMLLNVFELWVAMDMCAVHSCPGLQKFSPVFTPELLDALQLPQMSQMKRLQAIQEYLASRCSNDISPLDTIFSNSGQASFAVYFYNTSPSLKALRQRIQDDSDASHEYKEREWNQIWTKYTDLSTKIEQGTCICSMNADGSRNVKGCNKCWAWRQRKRLSIEAHEDFLPRDSTSAAILIFELGMPEYLRRYRDATWKIICDLTYPSRLYEEKTEPKLLLGDYHQLKPYGRSDESRFAMASKVKSFHNTHYKLSQANMSKSNVLLPMGPRFEYYDTSSRQWLGSFPKNLSALTVQHLCGVSIPNCLKSVIPSPQHPPCFGFNGSSSYQIQANRPKCPRQMPVHEFSAYQKLLGAQNLRWVAILIELSASNLNFSSAETMLLLSQLAIQAGPQDEGHDLRQIHNIFDDTAFVSRLMEQLTLKLSTIRTNRGELYCMELLINLCLRSYTLLSANSRRCEAVRLVESARSITLDWTRHFRDEFESAPDSVAAKKAAQNATWAALLCRKTFSVYLETISALEVEHLITWVESSISLQDGLPRDTESIPRVMCRLFVRDAQLAMRLGPLLKRSVETNPAALGSALVACSTNARNNAIGIASTYTLSSWEFLNAPYQEWVCVTMSKANTYVQSEEYAFHFIAGTLLVNGKALSKLPQDTVDSPDVKELFGDRHLLAYPSNLPGMTHRLRQSVEGNIIHFGRRGYDVIIRAERPFGLLEFVPRRVFLDPNQATFDVPKELLECVHWLDLRAEEVEFRRKPEIWRSRPRNWVLSIPQRQINRGNVYLICPYSSLFTKIYRLLQHFEIPSRITAYQPERGSINVALRDLELNFFVNRNGLLESRELLAEIDPDQDAGTWYGFQSKIVVRGTRTGRRSILVPLGQPSFKRHGIHVDIKVSSSTDYGKYDIDKTLSRLNCPPEPRLLYMKALLHALTSFVVPDPLTGKTGTEEALAILTSAASLPWSPLLKSSLDSLEMLRRLSPKREYYPKDRKTLQCATWDEGLTSTIQHDAFDRIVQKIVHKSSCIKGFDACDESLLIRPEVGHLRFRGEIRSLLRERETAVTHSTLASVTADPHYIPRDRETGTPKSSAVFNIVKAIQLSDNQMPSTKTYDEILSSWPTIGGIGDNTEVLASSLASILNCDVGEHWFGLVELCASSTKEQLAFTLGVLTFNRNCNEDILNVLAAYGCINDLKELDVPEHPSFVDHKSYGRPSQEEVMQLISKSFEPFVQDLTQRRARQIEQQKQHEQRCRLRATPLIERLRSQWPSPNPSFGSEEEVDFIDCELALREIAPDWQRRLCNTKLKDYTEKAQSFLGACQVKLPRFEPVIFKKTASEYFIQYSSPMSKLPVTLEGVATKSIVLECSEGSDFDIQKLLYHSFGPPQDISQHDCETEGSLEKLLQRFIVSPDTLRSQYAKDLSSSLAAVESTKEPSSTENEKDTKKRQKKTSFDRDVLPALQLARQAAEEKLELIKAALHNGDARFTWLDMANLWPAETFTDLLMLIRSTGTALLSDSMKAELIALGVSITCVQRLERIDAAVRKQDLAAVNAELRNPGHQNWDVAKRPDWLLIEIDSNILIRAEQVDVANAIINPSCGENAVLQMNMGKGKTSCIVPMAMSVLADRSRLARIIVPRALIFQTAQVLQSRLGHLVGREINHLAFTRRTPTTPDMLNYYCDEHIRVLNSGGIILTSAENILSFQLSGWQLLSDGKIEKAHRLLGIQDMLHRECRDVIDESDFTLGVKTQLIYPSGAQTAVDGNPWRWEVAEKILALLENHLELIRQKYNTSVVVVDRKPGFPIISFLREDPQDDLQQLIVDDIASGRTTIVQFSRVMTVEESKMVKQVLMSEHLDEKLFKKVVRMTLDRAAAIKSLLTARGLLRNRIAFLCLRKRWNVQYGLSLDRCAVAVPFEGKGVPSERAEFGHPDVAIFLTCLSFYYQGLTLDQFRESLQRVLRSDDPAAEFERWVGVKILPTNLSQWNMINIEDRAQIGELFNHLRVERTVINHYLNHFVFPIHAKQFEVKLQASAWDIPLIDGSLVKSSPTSSKVRSTGFSGTNDNKIVLPATIKQHDLPSLQHTNAEVLGYLLQKRNQEYEVAANGSTRLSESEFLKVLCKGEIKILIDAGAYVLEMSNKELAETWLKIDHSAKAAIYFGSDHRIWVKYKNKNTDVPLVATPFADDLSECLVYLDESHTRGIDLKLPASARGALTLAIGQTKDHTVQAAMRLRQLGTTQSVKFFAPPDVHQSLLDLCKPVDDKVDSSHVLYWLLEQTCRSNEDLLGLHFSQGIDFCHRKENEWQYKLEETDDNQRAAILQGLRRPESRTLGQLYGSERPQIQLQNASNQGVCSPLLREHLDGILQRRCLHANKEVYQDALEEVEQEREIEFQVEEVREIQIAKPYKALSFPGLHPSLYKFATSGRLAEDCGFQSLFKMLSDTDTGKKYSVCETPSKVFLSDEFNRTVETGKGQCPKPGDDYTRPVEWILWSPKFNTAIIVIPEEAELLLPTLRGIDPPKVHLICHAAPVTKSMRHLSTLQYYAIPSFSAGRLPPPWLATQIGILAGRMYFEASELAELKQVVGQSGVATKDTEPSRNFSPDQPGFLLEWLALRRNTRDILHTPMGHLCLGRTLTSNHPFFGDGA